MPLRGLLALSTALGGCLLALQPAYAQEAPPARVGQITALRGEVSFNWQADAGQAAGAQDNGWAAAQLNYPVIAGNTLYTQPDAEAAIAIDWSRITLAGGTEFTVSALGDHALQASEPQGEIYLDLRYLAPGETYTVVTPRGTVTLGRDGRYDIIAGDRDTPTRVSVLSGLAEVKGQAVALAVGAGQTGVLSGDATVTASLGAIRRDALMATMADEAAAPPPSYVPPSVSQMTGADTLSGYGSWSETPDYGAIWYPRVAHGWAPYRSGHWAYVQPWGWTWIASEPWGFAPSHYGRWVDIGDRWGWAPAPEQSAGYDGGAGGYPPSFADQRDGQGYYQPVYAPALVSFFGIAAAGAVAGSVGWVPLAPDEPYYPPYHCPPRYLRQINVASVRDVARIERARQETMAPQHFANHRAATLVPATAMRQGDLVTHYAHPASPTILAAARPISPAGAGSAGYPGHAAAPKADAAPPPRPAAFAAQRGLPAVHPDVPHPGVSHPGAAGPAAAFVPAVPVPHHPGPQAVPPTAQRSVPPELYPYPRHGAASPGSPDRAGHVAVPQLPHAAQFAHPPALAPAPRPAIPVYHPPAQAYHPPVEQLHPVHRPPMQQLQPIGRPPPPQPAFQRPAFHQQAEQPHPVSRPAPTASRPAPPASREPMNGRKP